MKILVLYAHPVETSYNAALHRTVLECLRNAGHEVDDCDLYAENFNPLLSREERLCYHEVGPNIEPVRAYVERLRRAEALVLCCPVWNYGHPAILKGYFDRVFLPGVSFKMVGGDIEMTLTNIGKIAVVTTYGGGWLRSFLAGDAPRKFANRILRFTVKPGASVDYLALYGMNKATDEKRARFIRKVKRAMERF